MSARDAIPDKSREQPVSLQVEVAGFSLDILLDYLYQIGVRQASQVFHEHVMHEIYYIESGEMDFACGEKTYGLDTGDLIVIRAGDSHRVVRYSENLRWFHLRFRMPSTPWESCMRTCHFPGYQPLVMADLIRDIRGFRLENGSDMALYRLRCYLGILFSHVLENLTPAEREDRRAGLRDNNRVIRYSQIDTFLGDNCANAVTLADLATYLNYSRIQTGRIVRECCGMSFTEKLREIRMRLAKQLLAGSDLVMEQVAERCGYQTRQGFESAFAKVEGITPAVYRKKHRIDGN